MDQKAIVKLCREMGCCDACCLRYLGLKKPKVYENSKDSILEFLDCIEQSTIDKEETQIILEPKNDTDTQKNSLGIDTNELPVTSTNDIEPEPNQENNSKTENVSQDEEINESSTRRAENGKGNSNGSESPPAKRRKTDLCVSCVGILQQSTWQECIDMVKEQLEKKRYECKTFACALSAPIATLLREKAIVLKIQERFSNFDGRGVTALKEAWKWSFCSALTAHVDKTLDSGAVSPLLVTVTVDYPDDLQELEILKTLAPSLFETRKQQKRRFAVEFTRRCVEQALDGATLQGLANAGWGDVPTVGSKVKCVSVICSHTPIYLGGRYIKLSRELPQTPWLVNGKRMMESSVQEIIFEHVARLYEMSAEEAEARLKFMSAGREDVDVRCLGDGRPFAIEITDPRRGLSAAERAAACDVIAASRRVIVRELVPVTRDDLALLKKGEESKTKSYEALCIKLTHSKDDEDKSGTPRVTETDIARVNAYTNTEEGEADVRVLIQQRTPIRVLHRRPLLTRTRRIYQLSAHLVPGHPQLFVVRVKTEAGTYMKEWCHGELRRTRPSLTDAIGARTDILALDVTAVDLAWPNKA